MSQFQDINAITLRYSHHKKEKVPHFRSEDNKLIEMAKELPILKVYVVQLLSESILIFHLELISFQGQILCPEMRPDHLDI